MFKFTRNALRVGSKAHRLTTTPLVGRSFATQSQASWNDGNSENTTKNSYGLIGLTVASIAFLMKKYQEKTYNCGIVAVVGDNDGKAVDFLLEGLTILKNRGYDSAGIATVSKGSDLAITKYASKESTSDCIGLVEDHRKAHAGHSVGIAHTRWATHGGKTDENAHPHTDYGNRVAITHNGTINNYDDIRDELEAQGIVFKSETDTEVIAHLIGQGLDKGLSTRDAVDKALQRLDGSWGLCVINKNNPSEIVVACNGSPLVVGFTPKRIFIASETAAFSKHTKDFVSMRDGEIGVIHPDKHTLDISNMQTAPDHEILLTPAPYAHFTLKEMLEQPEAIARALGYGARFSGREIILGGLDANTEKLADVRNLLLTGCGTSKFASELGARIIRDLRVFDSVQVVDSAEMSSNDVPPRSACLAVSQSGETKDVVRAIDTCGKENAVCMSVVNAVGSQIARKTGLGVYLNAGRENAVASTKAFTTQVTVLTLIGLWFHQLRAKKELEANPVPVIVGKKKSKTMLPAETTSATGIPWKKVDELIDALQRLPISLGMARSQHEKCVEVAKYLNGKTSMFILGKGRSEAIAMEGALKIKEMCYLHAEGYSGGALKHGPFAMIEDDATGREGATPIIMLILNDKHAAHMRIAAQEVKARGAKVFVITDDKNLAEGIDETPIVIPPNGPLTALTAVLPLQMIAYELALIRGVNPDTPRNLAKAVTTD